MIKNTRGLSNHDLYPNIEELLSKEDKVIITVKGHSMLPIIVADRDQVILEKKDFSNLEKGDIVLFKSKHGEYLLHRIHDTSDLGYLTIGDGNMDFYGWVRPHSIVAVVSKVVRKGKELDCKLPIWENVFRLWMYLLPIRGCLLNIYKGIEYIKYKLLS